MPIRTIDPATLKQMLDRHQALLVDVREPAEYRARHIAGARHMPLAKVDATSLPQDQVLVVHCLKGARGSSACEKLLKQNPALEIFNLEGGIDAWSAAGFPTVTAGKAVLPLGRQVQLAIGLILLAMSLLTLLWDPLFVLLGFVIGAGLTIAGSTGWCGLARLLALAPWNR